MVFDIFHAYGTESAKADIKRYEHFFAAHVFYFLQKFFGKVQPGSRRCGTALIAAVNGLVTLLVFKLLGNIRRQRRFAKPVQNFFKHAFKFKTGNASAKFGVVKYFAA